MIKYIVYCEQFCYPIFKEYLALIINKYNAELRVVNIFDQENYESDPEIVFIFAQKIPINIIDNHNINKILINIEQVTRDNWYNVCKSILDKNIKMIEYGPENIQILKNHPNIIYWPYQYMPDEINRLKTFLNVPKLYDVAFCGAMSWKREHILNLLKKNNISVLNVQAWGDDRDKMIAQCKILVNLHFYYDYNIYESIRCDRWVLAGMPVISESSLNNDILDINRLVIFAKYDELVNTIIRIIHNYDNFKHEYDTKYNDNITQIILNRDVIIDNIHT